MSDPVRNVDLNLVCPRGSRTRHLSGPVDLRPPVFVLHRQGRINVTLAARNDRVPGGINQADEVMHVYVLLPESFLGKLFQPSKTVNTEAEDDVLPRLHLPLRA